MPKHLLNMQSASVSAATLVRRTYWGEIQIFPGGEGESEVAGCEAESDVAGGETQSDVAGGERESDGGAIAASSATSTSET